MSSSSRSFEFQGADQLEELAEVGPFLDEVYTVAAACGIDVDAAIAEGAPWQFEFSLMHQPDALKAAEDTLYFKHITRKLTPPAPVGTNSHALELPRIAKDWRQALERFSAAESVRRILHPEFVSCFAACKQQEQDVFAAQVTDFEISTYRVSV